MAREDRRLEPALAPASGPVSVEHIEPAPVASGGRDGAHQSLSQGQALLLALAGLLAAVGLALDPQAAFVVAHHLFFGVFLLGGLTRLAAACTPLTRAAAPPLAD